MYHKEAGSGEKSSVNISALRTRSGSTSLLSIQNGQSYEQSLGKLRKSLLGSSSVFWGSDEEPSRGGLQETVKVSKWVMSHKRPVQTLPRKQQHPYVARDESRDSNNNDVRTPLSHSCSLSFPVSHPDWKLQGEHFLVQGTFPQHPAQHPEQRKCLTETC